MSLDDRVLGELIEQSQDLQSDAMKTTRTALADMVEHGHERRAHGEGDPEENRRFNEDRRRLFRSTLLAGSAFSTGIFGPALLRLMETPAFAQQSVDVQILQTAASLENLAVATYAAALGLPFLASAPDKAQGAGLAKAFAKMTMAQHAEHGKAFNGAVKALNGKEQNDPDPVLLKTVNDAKPGLTDLGKVVDLALTLEQTATEDYVAGIGALQDPMGRKTMSSIVGVESQHAATLRAVKALLAGNAVDLITLDPPVDAAKLPAAAGSVGFPDTFMGTKMARPNDEGAVK